MSLCTCTCLRIVCFSMRQPMMDPDVDNVRLTNAPFVFMRHEIAGETKRRWLQLSFVVSRPLGCVPFVTRTSDSFVLVILSIRCRWCMLLGQTRQTTRPYPQSSVFSFHFSQGALASQLTSKAARHVFQDITLQGSLQWEERDFHVLMIFDVPGYPAARAFPRVRKCNASSRVDVQRHCDQI